MTGTIRDVPPKPPRSNLATSRPPSEVTCLAFVAAIGLSAFLLFSLELLAGRLVLPVFGGTPGVWATTLSFFTIILLLGYLYAHFAAVRLSPLRGALLQALLGVVAVVLTLAAPADVGPLRNLDLPEAINVLFVVAVIAGAAGFLLASTTPLVSAWYAGKGSDPWWLYAVSNGASFAALFAYPFLVEPFIGLSAQRVIVGVGLVAYVAVIAVIAWRARAASTPSRGESPASSPAPSARRTGLWLVAAMVPAGLLAATTNFLQTDLVAAPFIWVGPLAVYLASFVVAFSERGRRILPAIDLMVPAAATLLWLPFVFPLAWPVVPLLVIELGSFAVIAVAIHGRLALDRPDKDRLTLFYIVLAAAGMLATVFVAVIAPLLFPDVYEYPLLLILGVVVLALLRPANVRWLPDLRDRLPATRALAVRLIPYLAITALLLVFAWPPHPLIVRLLVVGLIVVVVVATPRLLAAATPIVLIASLVTISGGEDQSLTKVFQGRSFFGVTRVLTSGSVNALYSGTTLHGLQFTDDRSQTPTTYYTAVGPLGDVYTDLRARTDGASVGAVGLGAGTVAAYSRRGDRLTFFEIDPLVIRTTYSSGYFTFLRESAVAAATLTGDGRLSLEAQPPGSFDLLVLDAFSSDSVPPHMLTGEAIQSFMRALRPGAVLAFNLSNRYYSLEPAVAATARSIGLDAFGRGYAPDDQAIEDFGATDSLWVVVGQPGDVARFATYRWQPVVVGGPVLTDDYPDITRVLRWAR